MKVAICLYIEPWLKANLGYYPWKMIKAEVMNAAHRTTSQTTKIRWFDQTKGAFAMYQTLWASYDRNVDFNLEGMLRDHWRLTDKHFCPEDTLNEVLEYNDIVIFETCLKEGYEYLRDAIKRRNEPYTIYKFSLLKGPCLHDGGLIGSRCTMAIDIANQELEDIKDDIVYEVVEILNDVRNW